jgi:hypothetical protein
VQYQITIYNTEEAVRALEGDEREEFEQAHGAVQRELRESGELVESNVFSDVDARVVRIRDGAPVVTEGRYSEGAVWAGGYYRVECASLERAVEIAGRFVVEARYAPIEVRRLGFD